MIFFCRLSGLEAEHASFPSSTSGIPNRMSVGFETRERGTSIELPIRSNMDEKPSKCRGCTNIVSGELGCRDRNRNSKLGTTSCKSARGTHQTASIIRPAVTSEKDDRNKDTPNSEQLGSLESRDLLFSSSIDMNSYSTTPLCMESLFSADRRS